MKRGFVSLCVKSFRWGKKKKVPGKPVGRSRSPLGQMPLWAIKYRAFEPRPPKIRQNIRPGELALRPLNWHEGSKALTWSGKVDDDTRHINIGPRSSNQNPGP